MTVPILNLDVDFEITKKVSHPTNEIELGDGYRQISNLSFEPEVEYSVQRTGLNATQLNEVLTQLETQAGAKGFYWQPNTFEPLAIYTCDEWDTSLLMNGLWSFSAVFKKDQSGECIAFKAFIDDVAIKAQLNLAKNFLLTYTRSTEPILINAQNVIANNFHRVLGRGGYLHPGSGTSEGQAVLIRALCRCFQVTGDTQFRTMAINAAEAFLTYFYNVPNPPTNPSDFFVPHWLVSAKQSFQGKGEKATDYLEFGYFDVPVTFTNGIGVIPNNTTFDGLLTAEVYTVTSPNALRLWRNIFSPIISGTVYPIDYWVSNIGLEGTRFRMYPSSLQPGGANPTSTSETAGTIRLVSNFTGTLWVTYTAYTGDTIALNERYEAYPTWRKLIPTEFNCAWDAIFWSYDAYKLLFQLTSNNRWNLAREATRVNGINSAPVLNITFWYKKDTSPNPFSYPGSQMVVIENTNSVVATRETTAAGRINWVRVVAAAAPVGSFPSIEIQNFAVQTGFQPGSTISVEYAHSNANTLMKVVLSTSPNAFDNSQLYEAEMLTGTANSVRSKTFVATDFIKWRNNPSSVWFVTCADNPIYTYSGSGGTVTLTREQVTIGDNKPIIFRINQNPGSGFSGAGLVLIQNPIVRPPRIRYEHSGANVLLRITDGSARRWDCTLVPTAWTSRVFRWSDFTWSVSNGSSQGSIEPDDQNPITNIEFVPTGTCVTRVWYATSGEEAEFLQTPVMIYKASAVDLDRNAHTFWIGDFKPSASTFDTLNYNPGVVPFTVNLLNGQIDAWRGIPMAGYQEPGFWREIGLEGHCRQALQFLSDAQTAYSQQSANRISGPFAPAYSWAYWDAGDYLANGLNKFGWDAPDPNSRWFPYQLRALVGVCYAWYLDPGDNLARQVAMNFLSFLDADYRKRGNINPLTDLPPVVDPQCNYLEPHCAALIMRAAMWANLANGNAEITFRLIKQSLDFLNAQWVSTGTMAGSWSLGQPFHSVGGVQYREWFGFWQAEIMDSLALLCQYKDSLRMPSCGITFLS